MAVRRATFSPTIGLEPDWIIVALPTALAIRVFKADAALFILALLLVVALFRKPDGKFRIQAGPMLLFFSSCAIVYTRPEGYFLPTISLLFGALILRLVITVDARRIIASSIDGFGLLLLVNMLAVLVGISTANSSQRATVFRESTGFVRTVFPFTGSINAASIAASAYLVAFVFLIRETGRFRRTARLVFAASAVFVIVESGSRTALAVTVVLSASLIIFPFITSWIAQAATLLAAVSAFVLPGITSSMAFIIKPLTGLAPGRETTDAGVVSLQGREQIWSGAINYWNEHINDLSDRVLGFGELGQYRSGASLTYVYIVRGLSDHPELAHVHNSFLQQLFDGGLLGWLLLVLAVFWTSARLARRRRDWDHWALCAISAMTAVLLCNTTEATMAPSLFDESFWLVSVFTAVVCQTSAYPAEGDRVPGRGEPADIGKST